MTNFVPDDWPQVIPRLSVADPEAATRFIKAVFGAEGRYTADRPTELRIGASLLMVAGVLERTPTTASLYVYVPDVDEAHQTALRQGAEELEAPRELPYGDRHSMVRDAWGTTWQIATHRGWTENSD